MKMTITMKITIPIKMKITMMNSHHTFVLPLCLFRPGNKTLDIVNCHCHCHRHHLKMVISKLLESLVISLALSSVPLTAVSQERLNWNWYYFCLGIGIFWNWHWSVLFPFLKLICSRNSRSLLSLRNVWIGIGIGRFFGFDLDLWDA